MDAITFRILISLTIFEELDMRLMDVITAYLYGSIDNGIYKKNLEGFRLLEANITCLVVCAQSNYNDLYMD